MPPRHKTLTNERHWGCDTLDWMFVCLSWVRIFFFSLKCRKCGPPRQSSEFFFSQNVGAWAALRFMSVNGQRSLGFRQGMRLFRTAHSLKKQKIDGSQDAISKSHSTNCMTKIQGSPRKPVLRPLNTTNVNWWDFSFHKMDFLDLIIHIDRTEE